MRGQDGSCDLVVVVDEYEDDAHDEAVEYECEHECD